MQILIEIPEEEYKKYLKMRPSYPKGVFCYIKAIQNGTVLPKGHGRLIDANATIEIQSGTHFEVILGKAKIEKCSIEKIIKAGNSEVPTIIPADKET